MVAVAGAVAEHCWNHITFDDGRDSWYEPNVMSESDWAGTGCTPGEPSSDLLRVIEHTFSLFNPDTGILWPDLIKEARKLITEATDIFGGVARAVTAPKPSIIALDGLAPSSRG
jgi:hypothetical protein